MCLNIARLSVLKNRVISDKVWPRCRRDNEIKWGLIKLDPDQQKTIKSDDSHDQVFIRLRWTKIAGKHDKYEVGPRSRKDNR